MEQERKKRLGNRITECARNTDEGVDSRELGGGVVKVGRGDMELKL